MLGTEGMLTFGGRVTSTRTDTLGWFDCSKLPSTGASVCSFQAGTGADTDAGTGTAAAAGDTDPAASNTWPHLKFLLQRMETIVAELGGVSMSALAAREAAAADASIGAALGSCHSRSKVTALLLPIPGRAVRRGEEG